MIYFSKKIAPPSLLSAYVGCYMKGGVMEHLPDARAERRPHKDIPRAPRQPEGGGNAARHPQEPASACEEALPLCLEQWQSSHVCPRCYRGLLTATTIFTIFRFRIFQ